MMKAHSVIVSVFIAFWALNYTACTNQNNDNTSSASASHIEFASTVYDFGDIPYESDGKCSFTFKNTSGNALLINTVRTSCGCTSPEWPDEPIEPGGSGSIGITYNTNIAGSFNKSITVYSNAANSPIKLFIKGTVQPKPVTNKTN